MGPSQCPDTCALTCTAWTTTSSLLVAVPSTLMVAAPLITIECTTHRCGTSAIQRSFFSSEIIVVNSELTIKFLSRNSFKMAATTNNNNLNASILVFMGSGLGTEDGGLPQVPAPLAHYYQCSWQHVACGGDRQGSHPG